MSFKFVVSSVDYEDNLTNGLIIVIKFIRRGLGDSSPAYPDVQLLRGWLVFGIGEDTSSGLFSECSGLNAISESWPPKTPARLEIGDCS